MVNISRGDIYWVNLDPTIGSEIKKKRPSVIVSNNAANKQYNQVTVVPLTSKKLDHIQPFQILIPKEISGLQKDSKALAEQVRTVSKLRLAGKAGNLPEILMQKINKALCLHLGLH